MRKIDDGARRERSDVHGQREALTSGQRINQSHLRRPWNCTPAKPALYPCSSRPSSPRRVSGKLFWTK